LGKVAYKDRAFEDKFKSPAQLCHERIYGMDSLKIGHLLAKEFC